MSRLEGSRWRLRRRGRCGRLWNLNVCFFAFCSGPNVNAGTSKAAEKTHRYHLVRGGLIYAQPRSVLRRAAASFWSANRNIWFAALPQAMVN